MNIVIVASCLTGGFLSKIIANIFREKAEKRGHKVEVEIQGTFGICQRLLDKDIESADIVVLSSINKILDRDRFNNKRVIEVKGQEIIKNCEGILDQL